MLKLTNGVGVDAALKCVGTNEAMQTALAIARLGSIVGYDGISHGVELPVPNLFVCMNYSLRISLRLSRRMARFANPSLFGSFA